MIETEWVAAHYTMIATTGLFVADDHYHCVACGEYGNVIYFVAKLYVLSLHDAAKKLAYDFGIRSHTHPAEAVQGGCAFEPNKGSDHGNSE